jgi:hypothetical protein
MQAARSVSAALAAALTFALSFAGVTQSEAANNFTADPNSVTVLEQAAPVVVSPNFQVSSTAGFSGKHIEATLNSYSTSDQLSLLQDSSVTTSLNVVSIVNNEVWVGKGDGTAEKVGQVDSTDNGNGRKLRVNFISTFGNAGFEDATTISPWTSFLGQVNLGTTVLAGFQTHDPKENTAQYPRAGSSPSNDDTTLVPNNQTFSVASVNTDKFAGSRSLMLRSQSLRAPGGSIVHGPAAWSAEFPGASGQQLSFAWRANAGDDNYHVYAALLRTDGSMAYTERWTEILYQTGNSSNASTTWARSNVTIPATGTYRFVFVAGSQDFTNGTILGATLFVDDVQVLSSSVPPAVATAVARRIAYQNTSDAPVASRTMSITGVNELNESATSQLQINITAVDDQHVATSTYSFFVNSAASDSFAVRAGVIAATDVDGDSLTLDIASASSETFVHGGITYDRKLAGQFADFWVDQQSLRWALAPKSEAMEGVLSAVEEHFPVQVRSSGSASQIVSVTVSARITYDMKAGAPTIRAIYSELSADQTHITYEVEFDEYVDDFTAADITLAGTSGSTGWVKSEPQLVLSTTKYRFFASNPNAVNGGVTFTLNTSSIRDFAFPPNNLSSGVPSGTNSSQVTISRFAQFDPGPASTLGGSGSKLAPEFDLSTWGEGIAGLRIRISNAQPGDSLVFSNAGGVTGTLTSSGSVLLLSGATTLTDAQWETAIRSVTFSTTNNAPVLRNIEYHLKPKVGYDFDSGTIFVAVARSSTTWTQARDLAAASRLFGMSGYLATPTTVGQQNAAADASAAAGTTYNWLGITENEAVSGDITISNNIPRDQALVTPGFNVWRQGEPNNAGDPYIHNWNLGQSNGFGTFTWSWNDHSITASLDGYIIEYGLRGSDDVPSQLTKTRSHQVDLVRPSVTSVTAASGTYGRSEAVDIAVNFTEAVTVTGSPASRLEILPGKFADYQSGSGTNTLVYRYVVESGVTSSDLSYVATSSLAVRSHVIRDAAGNDANLELPAIGAVGSLVFTSDVVLDGTNLRIRLTTNSTASSQVSLQFHLSSAEQLNCNSLSASDFSYSNLLSSSFTVTPSGNASSCSISIQHSIPKASFGPAMLSPSSSFEVVLADGSTYSQVIVVSNSILVTNPADPGKGQVLTDTSNLDNRQRPSTLLRIPARQLMPGGSAAAADALANRNALSPGTAVLPALEIRGDFRSVSNIAEVISARKEQIVRAGDQVTARIQITASQAAAFKVISYINVGSGFLFSGERDFDPAGEVATEPMVFTQPGEYIKRLYIVPKTSFAGTGFPTSGFGQSRGSLFPMQTRLFSFFVSPFSTNPISENQLAAINSHQSLELVIVIQSGDTVALTTPPTPTPTSEPVRPSRPAPVTPTPTATPTVTPTPTPTATPTQTPRPTPTPTPTQTLRPTPSPTPTSTPSPTATPSPTPTPSATPIPTPSPTPSQTEPVAPNPTAPAQPEPCLLYTSDAADEC